MNDRIELEFDNKLSDHIAAERLFYKSTFWSKGDKIAAIMLAIGAIIFVALGQFWALVFIPLAIVEWFHLLSPWVLRTAIFFKRNPKFLETYRLSFSDSGIDFKTETINSHIAWTHYSKIMEDERVILLVYGTRMYTVIPTRAFHGESQLKSFTDLIHRQIRTAVG